MVKTQLIRSFISSHSIRIVKPKDRRYIHVWRLRLLVLGALFSALSMGCGQKVSALSPSDSRLPAEAKQRIADAEDAVIVSQSRAADARHIFEEGQARMIAFDRATPELGSATSAAQQLNRAQLMLSQLNLSYAEADVELSQARLQLVYAQTAMRYDLAVYDLYPLQARVDQKKDEVIQLRSARKKLSAELKSDLDAWWSAYQTLSKSTGTHAYWVHEISEK